MKDDRMKDVLESIAERGVSDDVDLWPHIAEKIETKTLMQTVRTRPALALVLVLLALALLSGVAYAIGKVTGYIPGVGIVDQSIPLRVLAEPVSQEREGITLTVNQVVADSERTFVEYVVDGIPIRGDQPSMCYTVPLLQLPDGSSLELISGESGGFGGEVGTWVKFETTVASAPIPVDVDRVTFALHCVLPEGLGPEDWRIPLNLVRAPEDYATPAVEIGATFIASNPAFVVSPTPTTDMRIFTSEPSDTLPATPSPVPNGSGLYLEKVIELPSSYILVGNFTDAGDLPGGLVLNLDPYEDLPRIENSAGIPVDFKVRTDVQPEMGSGIRYWAFEIAKPVRGPLTITLDQVNIAMFYTFEFQLDAGANPQPGQKWELNLTVHLGNYEYVMDSVEVIENGYFIKYHSGTDVPEGASPLFNIIGHTPEQGSSTLRDGKTSVQYTESLVYPSPLPTGQLTIQLTSMESVPLQGPWTLTWTPPSQ